jgi:hypothetical protein
MNTSVNGVNMCNSVKQVHWKMSAEEENISSIWYVRIFTYILQ